MTVDFSIKNVPDDLAQRVRERAAKNHRSVQGELMSIIETACQPGTLPPMQIYEMARRMGLRSNESSVDMIRADRDRDDHRYGR